MAQKLRHHLIIRAFMIRWKGVCVAEIFRETRVFHQTQRMQEGCA